MEALTRLVTESLVRHGFDRPLDYRRLHWSRWFRCESHHSLLVVPSQPGVFAVAEEITHVAADAFVRPPNQSPSKDENPVPAQVATASSPQRSETSAPSRPGSREPEAPTSRRMLAVTQFFEDDDMAFVLDRMLSRENPMRARLISGRYFVRFVAIEDQSQRRSICNALNQWLVSSAEKATGIGSHFATSLELTPATEYVPQPDPAQANLFDSSSHLAGEAFVRPASASSQVEDSANAAAPLDSGAATNIHCPSPFPAGF